MIRVLQIVEHNILVSPPKVVQLVAGVAKTVIPDQTQAKNPQPPGELCQRLVQAIGGDVYLAFGVGLNDTDAGVLGEVDDQVFHCFLANGQQRDISNDRTRVVAYSTTASRVAVELRWRVCNISGVQTLQ